MFQLEAELPIFSANQVPTHLYCVLWPRALHICKHTHMPTQTLTSALLKHSTVGTLEPHLILVRSAMSTYWAQRWKKDWE